jgi:hypothetical protein
LLPITTATSNKLQLSSTSSNSGKKLPIFAGDAAKIGYMSPYRKNKAVFFASKMTPKSINSLISSNFAKIISIDFAR